jgi:hypothetical protein
MECYKTPCGDKFYRNSHDIKQDLDKMDTLEGKKCDVTLRETLQVLKLLGQKLTPWQEDYLKGLKKAQYILEKTGFTDVWVQNLILEADKELASKNHPKTTIENLMLKMEVAFDGKLDPEVYMTLENLYIALKHV